MYWETLGIEPTIDIKKIKTAYAALAKKYNPEEHPEEFKRIYSAYKAACAYAKNGPSDSCGSTDNALENSTAAAEENSAEYDFGEVNASLHDYGEVPPERKMAALLAKMKRILADESARNDTAVWKNFFDSADFELFVYDRLFRREAAYAVFGIMFSRDAALAVAAAFGNGSDAKAVNYYPAEEWTVEISERTAKICSEPEKPSVSRSSPFNADMDRKRLFILAGSILFAIICIFIGEMYAYYWN